jgi:hypothetical protein
MMHKQSTAKLVLAAFPSAKGFGYAVFEGQNSLIDWGVRGVHGAQKNRESLQKMREVVSRSWWKLGRRGSEGMVWLIRRRGQGRRVSGRGWASHRPGAW